MANFDPLDIGQTTLLLPYDASLDPVIAALWV
jgi:hypothetical protein